MEVSCPTCQTAMIVPQPLAPEPPAGPKGKLSMTPSTVQHSSTSAKAASKIVRKGKKVNWGLYGGLAAGLAVIGAGIYFGPQLYDKYQEHKEQATAAAVAATNTPPPPPPDLNADEILKKVSALYKEIPSFSVHGDSTATMDMSQINPMLTAPIQTTAKFSMLLGKPDRYRIDWEREIATKTTKGSAWSMGKGDYVLTGTTPIRMKDRQTALTTAGSYSGMLGVYLATSFFDQTNSLEAGLKSFTKTNNETLDGRKCYVLSGRFGSQKMLFWIHKDDFLIAQAQVTLGGKMDDSLTGSLSAAQKKQLQMMEKMKGQIVETYTDIETNRTVTDADFKVALAMGTRQPAVTSQARMLADPGSRRGPPGERH